MGGDWPEASIIVVCDTDENLEVLDQMLRRQGYRVMAFRAGLALEAAGLENADLVLLDFAAPNADPCEFCRRFKSIPAFRDVPVIFVSARSDLSDKTKAFHAGAVDYVTKPFDVAELEARIDAQLRARRFNLRLKEQNGLLLARNETLHRLEQTRDELAHMIVHDMRSPLTGIRGGLMLLLEDLAPGLPPTQQRDLELAFQAAQQLTEMVSSLLDIRNLEAGTMPLQARLCDLGRLVRESVKTLTVGNHCRIEVKAANELTAFCDPEVTGRILTTMIGNAVKFTPQGGLVRVDGTASPDAATVEVTDNGPGIPPEFQREIFEKAGQIEGRKMGKKYANGLGLTFCRLAVNAQGGEMGLRSEAGRGSTFWFKLPASDAQAEGNRRSNRLVRCDSSIAKV